MSSLLYRFCEQPYLVYKTETRKTRATVRLMPKSLQAQRYRQLPGLLREMREAAGMTQRDLAKKLKMSHSLVHNSETAERRVDVAEFADWASACGMDPVQAFANFVNRRQK